MFEYNAAVIQKRTRSPPPIVEDTSRKPLLHRSTVECAHTTEATSLHGLRDVVVIRHEPCCFCKQARVPRIINRSLSE